MKKFFFYVYLLIKNHLFQLDYFVFITIEYFNLLCSSLFKLSVLLSLNITAHFKEEIEMHWKLTEMLACTEYTLCMIKFTANWFFLFSLIVLI